MAGGRYIDACALAAATNADADLAYALSGAARTRAEYAQRGAEIAELEQRLQLQADTSAPSPLDIPSPVAADGKVYLLSEDGETVVVAAGRTPRVLARNKLNARQLASPAISGGRLFIRSDDAIYAIGK